MTAESMDVRELKKRLRQVTVGARKYWLAEGDLLLDEGQLASYARGGQANAPPAPRTSPYELIGITDAGKIVRWKLGLELTYSIIQTTFGQTEYATVRTNMKQATADWEQTCGVKFRDRSDEEETGANALFTVEPVDTGGKFIAAAFFPNEPAERRHLVIDPSYFTTSFNKVGVLRHELGHVLGFRHEHISPDAPAICPKEDLENTIDLSKYDPKSVMHYFCGGVGSPDLAITEKDLEASQRLYGPPLDRVKYVE
jgi:hypothetical protein